MGFLKKALGKSIGGKLLGKAIKKDPLASKLIKKDPLGSKLVGTASGQRSGAPKRGGLLAQGLMKKMKTGGNTPAEPITPAAKKMANAGMRPRRTGRFNP